MHSIPHRLLPLILLLTAMCALPAPAAAAQLNDQYGNATSLPTYGGTTDSYVQGNTMTPGRFEWGTGGTWAWDAWFAWTPATSGKARLDLCQTAPAGDTWYLAAMHAVDGPSPLSYPAAASSGCTGVAMPQDDFDAVAGTDYRIAIGAQQQKNQFIYLRLTLAPIASSAPDLTGSGAVVGNTLTVKPPTWKTPAASHTLVGPTWKRCVTAGDTCTVVATDTTTYTLQAADVGTHVHAEYTATNDLGSVTTKSYSTVAVTGPPTVTGDANGDGIPDNVATALGLPATGAADAMCTGYSLCPTDPNQQAIFANLASISLLTPELALKLIGSATDDLIVATQKLSTDWLIKPVSCDGKLGNDVCVGSPGVDQCIAGAGNDFCMGNSGNDICVSSAGKDFCYGGEGNDICRVRQANFLAFTYRAPKAKCLGGLGTDTCAVTTIKLPNLPFPPLPTTSCAGGAGRDTCSVLAGTLPSRVAMLAAGLQRTGCTGGVGNDLCSVLKAASNPFAIRTATTCAGEAGSDTCVAKGASSWTLGVFAAANAVMSCTGGAGADTLWTLNGKPGDTIKGGGQSGDYCFADKGDIVTGCGQTLVWRTTSGMIPWIDGTKAQQDAYAKQADVTRNDATVDEERIKELMDVLNDLSGQLNTINQSQTDAMRAIMAV